MRRLGGGGGRHLKENVKKIKFLNEAWIKEAQQESVPQVKKG